MVFSRQILKVCQVSPVNAPTMSALAARTFRESFSAAFPQTQIDMHIREFYSIERQQQELTNPNQLILTVADNDIPCGYVKLHLNSASSLINSPSSVELADIYLLSDWIGGGIGSQLIRTALRYACLHGKNHCWLKVWIHNTQAIQFFRYWGFLELGYSSCFIGNVEATCLVMARQLL